MTYISALTILGYLYRLLPLGAPVRYEHLNYSGSFDPFFEQFGLRRPALEIPNGQVTLFTDISYSLRDPQGAFGVT